MRSLILGAMFTIFVAASGRASASTITASISVAALPTMITLCRDPAAYEAYGFDEVWEIFIDIDGNPDTGDMGADAAIEVETHDVGQGVCQPETVSTESNLDTALFAWDASSKSYVQSDVPVSVTLDFVHSKMTLTMPSGGALEGLSANSKIVVTTIATYTQNNNEVEAGDVTAVFNFGTRITSSAHNVQDCTKPCTGGSDWIQSIDITGASFGDELFQSSFE